MFGNRLPGELIWRDRLVWAGPPGVAAADDPIPFVTYPPPSLTRRIALQALDRAGRVWRTTCVSDSQLGLRAAALAGLGYVVHAASLLPDGLVELEAPHLPALCDLEFVLMHRRTHPTAPEQALHAAVTANARRLHGLRPSDTDGR
ncbi:LysR substrate-binding domain-containing protein [Nocardia sp. CWNU-33]|uniref:LysR substrate-binding domain-containing protein n=1 Tax=Nocardia sp. CWNU-33 TaxID=3392117 RepID=UPI00398F5220